MYIAIESGLFDERGTFVYYSIAIPDRIIKNPFPIPGKDGNAIFFVPFVREEGKWSQGMLERIGTIAYAGAPDERGVRIFQQENIPQFSGAGAALLRKLHAKGYSPEEISLLSFVKGPNTPSRTVEPTELEEIARQLTLLNVNASLF